MPVQLQLGHLPLSASQRPPYPAPSCLVQVAPGARLSVGSQDNALTCSFTEGGGSALTEMLMKGLAAGASKEVQERLKDL